MRALIIAAGLFFTAFAALIIYAGASGPGHEYDLKYVLQIDARKMPKAIQLPEVAPMAQGETPGQVDNGGGRAEAAVQPDLQPYYVDPRAAVTPGARGQE